MATFNININEVTNETVGENVSKNELVYLSTDGKWYLANASLLSKSTTELRIALEDGLANTQVQMLAHGYINLSPFVMSSGSKYYVSDTNGEITPSLLMNKVIRYVGTAFSSSVLLFNPDQTYIHDNARKINGVAINFSHSHVEADIIDLDKYTKAEVDALINLANDKNYVHNQLVSSNSWVINHNLNKKPSIVIQDGLGNTVSGDIVYNDDNNLTLNFSSAFTGVAYLN